jgi:photosystem II stability/assembly factor-like uncharacterized protein
MKKILILVFVIINSVTNAQFGWHSIPSGTTQNLNQVLTGNTRVWICGDNGTLLRSTNMGLSFEIINTGSSLNFNSVLQVGNSCFIVCDSGKILKSTNLTTWQMIQTPVTENLNSIRYLSSLTYIAAGDNGTLLRSTNNGNNWQSINITSEDLNGCITNFNDVFVAGNNGKILKSSDLGANWNTINTGISEDLNSIDMAYFFSENYYLYASGNSRIIKSTDQGTTWTIIPAPEQTNIKSVSVYIKYYVSYTQQIKIVYLWAACDNGKLYKTSDDGITWIQQLSGNNNSINSIDMADLNYGFIVTNQGRIMKDTINTYMVSAVTIEANNIRTWYSNTEIYNHNYNIGPGFEWPKGTNKYAIYASGLYIGAKMQNDTNVSVSEYDTDFKPGYTNSQGKYYLQDILNYRVFKLTHGINNTDRSNWPNALLGNSDQDAPVYFDNSSNSWKPLDYGDQTLFCSMTDSYEYSRTYASSFSPLNADIKKIVFSFDEPGSLSNTIFEYYRIINKSNKIWNEAYFMTFSDDDLGEAFDDKMGCDTNLNFGYTYNSTNNDNTYGAAPPAAGTLMLKGPSLFTGNNNDTSLFCYGTNKKIRTGYKDQNMFAFNMYGDDTPANYREAYGTMKGLNCYMSQFTPWINPITNQVTRYVYSGDPVTNTGWIDPWGGDARYWLSSGPVNILPGDTVELVYAQIIGRGSSNINSIAVLKQYAQEVKNYYKNCFGGVPIGIEPISQNIPDKFKLYQNYPNPFNPKTILRFALPEGRGQRTEVRLVIYNAIGQVVETLVNNSAGSGLNAGTYEVEFDGSNLASGVYYYSLVVENELIDTKKMVLIK